MWARRPRESVDSSQLFTVIYADVRSKLMTPSFLTQAHAKLMEVVHAGMG